jgi:LacI family transcriptional regulator
MQERTKTTIYDVAARAGVAISTVSRVLNESNDVSDATRAKVLRAIEDLQFRPDRTAKTLAQKQTKSIAIAIPSFTTPFHNEILKGVRTRLHDNDIDLLLFDLGSKSPGRRLLNFLKRGAVDGLLLALSVDESIAGELEALHAPVILIGNKWAGYDSFHWDDYAGAHAAVNHLLDLGHRHIAMIPTPSDTDHPAGRIKGYLDALAEAGITSEPEWIQAGRTEKHAGVSEESGYEAMQVILQTTPSVTAVFAGSDAQAVGAWHALREADLRVPEDIAVVGYDDVKTSKFIGLSSAAQNMQEIGRRATDVLLRRLQGDVSDRPVDVLTTPRLVVRESSRYMR